MLCHLLTRSTFLFQPQEKKKVRKTWAVLKGTLNEYTMLPKSLMTYKKPRVYCYHFMGWRWSTVSYFKCSSKTCLFKISSPEVFLTDSIPICPLVTPSSSTVHTLHQGSGQRPQEQAWDQKLWVAFCDNSSWLPVAVFLVTSGCCVWSLLKEHCVSVDEDQEGKACASTCY